MDNKTEIQILATVTELKARYHRRLLRKIAYDGGPGSGNHGHKGVPGQLGGSAASSPLNDRVNAAMKLGDKERNKVVQDTIADIPVGMKFHEHWDNGFQSCDVEFTKISEDKLHRINRYPDGKVTEETHKISHLNVLKDSEFYFEVPTGKELTDKVSKALKENTEKGREVARQTILGLPTGSTFTYDWDNGREKCHVEFTKLQGDKLHRVNNYPNGKKTESNHSVSVLTRGFDPEWMKIKFNTP